MTTKEIAQQIRRELKGFSYGARQVSVRCDTYSMGATIHVTIRERGIRLARVQEIATKHERIRRCSVTGEILGGGNTYVDVRFDFDLLQEMDAEMAALVPAEGSGDEAKIGEYTVREDGGLWHAWHSDPRSSIHSHYRDGLVRILAERLEGTQQKAA